MICMFLLTGCTEYTEEEKQKVDDLVNTQSSNFIQVAKEQYGDVKVLDIEGETYTEESSDEGFGISTRAGKNLTGTIEPKEEVPFDVVFDVESQTIHSHRNLELINQSMSDELSEYGINVLAIEHLDSTTEKPKYSEDIRSYKDLVDLGKSMRFRVVTDTELGKFDPDHFNGIYDEMLKVDEKDNYLRIYMTQVVDTSDDNVRRLMRHWKHYGMAFSKHESILYKGEYVNGDPRLSDYDILATLNLDDSRDGAMKYTDSNDVRIVTYRTPNDKGEHTLEIELAKQN